jgi:hypothetical protein
VQYLAQLKVPAAGFAYSVPQAPSHDGYTRGVGVTTTKWYAAPSKTAIIGEVLQCSSDLESAVVTPESALCVSDLYFASVGALHTLLLSAPRALQDSLSTSLPKDGSVAVFKVSDTATLTDLMKAVDGRGLCVCLVCVCVGGGVTGAV